MVQALETAPAAIPAKTIVVVVLAGLVLLAAGCGSQEKEPAQSSEVHAEGTVNQTGFAQEFEILAASLVRQTRADPYSSQPFSGQFLERLKEFGMAEPESTIVADLRNHPEFIPYPGELGGTMAFRNARVVRFDRVVAEFDDGHYGGWAWLAFEVKDTGAIEWKLLYAKADGRDAVMTEEWK